MKRERRTFLIDPLTGDRLKAIKARSGLSESEQVRRAITLWLQTFEWPIRGRSGAAAGSPHPTGSSPGQEFGPEARVAADDRSGLESPSGSVTS
jgi:hypothetical protein